MSRPRRVKETAAYVVPQRRGVPRGGPAARGLNDLEYGFVEVLLLYTKNGPLSYPQQECPFRCRPLTDGELNNLDEVMQQIVLESTGDDMMKVLLPKQLHLEDGAEDLLLWFRQVCLEQSDGPGASQDTGARMVLQPGFSAEERQPWHRLAASLGLYSASRGFGDSRRVMLAVSPLPSRAQPGPSSTEEDWRQAAPSASQEASDIWALIAEEYGGHSRYSVAEIEERLVSGEPLPEDIVRLQALRDEGMQMWQAISRGDEQRAVDILTASKFPKQLAFKRSPDTQAYAIHEATERGLYSVALELAIPERYPGVMSQQNAAGKLPLTIACNRFEVELVVSFMQAGARDIHGDLDALHRVLSLRQDHNAKKVLNQCELTSAFRRKARTAAQPMRSPAKESPNGRAQGATNESPAAVEAQAEAIEPSDAADATPDGNEARRRRTAARRQVANSGVNMINSLLQGAADARPARPLAEVDPQPRAASPRASGAAPAGRADRGSGNAAQSSSAVDEPTPVRTVRGRGIMHVHETEEARSPPRDAERSQTRASRAAGSAPRAPRQSRGGAFSVRGIIEGHLGSGGPQNGQRRRPRPGDTCAEPYANAPAPFAAPPARSRQARDGSRAAASSAPSRAPPTHARNGAAQTRSPQRTPPPPSAGLRTQAWSEDDDAPPPGEWDDDDGGHAAPHGSPAGHTHHRAAPDRLAPPADHHYHHRHRTASPPQETPYHAVHGAAQPPVSVASSVAGMRLQDDAGTAQPSIAVHSAGIASPPGVASAATNGQAMGPGQAPGGPPQGVAANGQPGGAPTGAYYGQYVPGPAPQTLPASMGPPAVQGYGMMGYPGAVPMAYIVPGTEYMAPAYGVPLGPNGAVGYPGYGMSYHYAPGTVACNPPSGHHSAPQQASPPRGRRSRSRS